MPLVLTLLGIALLIALPASAQAPIEEMKQKTVSIRIWIRGVDQRGTLEGDVGGGSGFVINGGRHVVSNDHVCKPDLSEEGIRVLEERVYIQLAPGEQGRTLANVIHREPIKDLCVLEPVSSLGRPPAVLGLNTTAGQDVIAMGFPGAGERGVMSDVIVKITEGVLSSKVQGNPKIIDAALIQTDVAINPGNSGGPLFDACGRVLAVNTRKATGTAMDNVGWSVRSSEVVDFLARANVGVETTEEPCLNSSSPATGDDSGSLALTLLQLGAIILALAAAGVGSTRKGRQLASEAVSRYTRRGPPAPPGGKPVLKGISGFYAGTTVELSGKTWSLGRDPRVANLVFPPDAEGVSKRHSTLSYHDGAFTLEDAFSTNGTFLTGGDRLSPGESRKLRPGERFYLGDRDNLFEVNVE